MLLFITMHFNGLFSFVNMLMLNILPHQITVVVIKPCLMWQMKTYLSAVAVVVDDVLRPRSAFALTRKIAVSSCQQL